MRLSLLTAKGQGRRRPSCAIHRDAQDVYGKLERQRFATAGPQDVAATSFLPYTAVGKSQLDHLEASLDAVRNDGVTGDFVECGTGRGGGAIFMRPTSTPTRCRTRGCGWWTGSGPVLSPSPAVAARPGVEGLQADLNMVRDGFARFDVLDDRVRFVQGPSRRC